MGRRLCEVSWLFQRSGETDHDLARHDKSKETHEQPLPMTTTDKIKTHQRSTCSQQQAAEERKRRLLGRRSLANRPPKAAKKYHAEQDAGHRCQHEAQSFSHHDPLVPPSSPCLPRSEERRVGKEC